MFIAAVSLAAGSWSFAATPTFVGANVGTIQNTNLTEASDVAPSKLNPNVLWMQNDSGNPPQLFAMTPAGTNLGTYNITGASNTDWEDIDAGPGPVSGVQYLYIGDIGDNNANRSSISVYRVVEPTVSDTQAPVTASIGGEVQFKFVYPDGPRDAESMFVDPATKDIWIISKTNPNGDTAKHVYEAPYPQSTTSTTTLTLVTTLPVSTHLTSADISPDGSEIIVRGDASNTGLMYIRPAGGTVADAFATVPISIPLISDPQGEGIGFDAQGRGYFTSSEGKNSPINYFNLVPPPAGAMYWDADGVTAGSSVTTGAGTGGIGSWSSSGVRWYNGSADVQWAAGNDAIFWGTAATVTLSAAQTVNSLSFKSDGYVLTAQTLTMGGPSISVDAGMTATINSVVAGTAGLVKNGGGTLNLGTANTYSGGTIVNGGVLGIVSSSVGANPSSPVLNISINNGAMLRYDITGLTLAVNREVMLGSGGGVIDVQNFSDAIAGSISGSSLTKVGSGTLSLTNVNTYTGATNVSAGTLVVTANQLGSAGVNVSSGAAMSIAAGSGAVIKTAAISTAGTGKIDVADGKLIVTGMAVGVWNGSNYDGVSGVGQIRPGRWDLERRRDRNLADAGVGGERVDDARGRQSGRRGEDELRRRFGFGERYAGDVHLRRRCKPGRHDQWRRLFSDRFRHRHVSDRLRERRF